MTANGYVEVWDGSVPPGGYVCSVCEMPVETEPCTQHAPQETLDALHDDRPPRTFTVTLEAGLKLLNANQRLHHRVKAPITKALRDAGRQAAENAQLPALQRAHIIGQFCPPTRRKHDVGNLYPSFKAAVDGLVDYGVLPDDDNEHLIGPDMRPGPIVKGGRLVLHITELPAAAS